MYSCMIFVRPILMPSGLMGCVTFMHVREFWLVSNAWPPGIREM